MFSVCSICFSTVKFPNELVKVTNKSLECALCFGILQNIDLHNQIIEKTKEEFKKNAYDGNTFLLALNTPVTMHFREIIMSKLLGDAWVPVLMSPKGQFSMLLMTKISETTGLKPTLNSNLVLTITLTHNEFIKSDIEFFVVNMPQQLFNCGKKRKRPIFDDVASFYTKVRLNQIENGLNEELASKYKLISPTEEIKLSVRFERDSIFVAGRYLKFSRTLPQSPWTAVPYALKVAVGEVLKEYFRADNYRFVSCGREDIDVRMLGNGRPFAVELLNTKITESLNRFSIKKTLQFLEEKINKDHIDIKAVSLCRVNSKQVLSLNVGVDEKRKIYSALCYSKVVITAEMMDKLHKAVPVEISQKTVIRVLKRRPLIDRKRTIFALNAFQLDDYHFVVKLETQAGTYVKEFIHGDFGRTRPSMGTLMGLECDELDILELDVEGVHFDWPPAFSSKDAHNN